MWTPGTTAQQLHLDLDQLNSVIRITEGHKAEMDRLNNEVQGLGPTIRQYMNSDAGAVMNNRLAEWTGDYNMLAGDLQQLNDRVTYMRDALVQSHNNAVSTTNK